jgi:hypothetical protein
VRLENDLGLIIDDKMNSETVEDLYKIQWLEDGRTVSVKPAASIVLFQKKYAMPELIQSKYERGKVSKLEPKKLKKYKFAAYHEHGGVLHNFAITAVEYDDATEMYRVSWKDGEEWDNLKSLEELRETETSQPAEGQPFWKKLEALDPKVQTPVPTKNLKRKRREKTQWGEREHTRQEKTQLELETKFTPTRQKRSDGIVYMSFGNELVLDAKKLRKKKQLKEEKQFTKNEKKKLNEEKQFTKNEMMKFLAEVRQCKYIVPKTVFDKDEDGHFTIRKPMKENRETIFENYLAPGAAKLKMSPIICNKLTDLPCENVYFGAENLHKCQKLSREEIQQKHTSFRKKRITQAHEKKLQIAYLCLHNNFDTEY